MKENCNPTCHFNTDYQYIADASVRGYITCEAKQMLLFLKHQAAQHKTQQASKYHWLVQQPEGQLGVTFFFFFAKLSPTTKSQSQMYFCSASCLSTLFLCLHTGDRRRPEALWFQVVCQSIRLYGKSWGNFWTSNFLVQAFTGTQGWTA